MLKNSVSFLEHFTIIVFSEKQKKVTITMI